MSRKTNKKQHTKKALLEALEKSLGVVTQACKIVGINRSTFYQYVKDDAEFAAEIRDIEDVALDFAESQLFKQIQEGNTTATIFFLKTKGKRRGYVERQEVTGVDGGAIKTESVNLDKLSIDELKELDKTLDKISTRGQSETSK